jgi:aspartyl-tRNA(Asn)/glutamyl-tRNA(Gln) amidotransferase subunit A
VPPPAERDATCVARLRRAGAELLCKTNLLEYAAGAVNPAYGMVYNPRDLSRTSGGSSSGSAALVAAGVLDHALGTDTGGSIRIPAAYCGIVGHKPTLGLVPTDGVFPLSPTCDHVGTLTRTAQQSLDLLAVLADTPLERRDVRGLRLGVLRAQVDDPDVRPGVREAVLNAIDRLAAAGLRVVEVDLPELELCDASLGAIVVREAYESHRRFLDAGDDSYGPNTRMLLDLGARCSDEEYAKALATRETVIDGFARLLSEVDVLVGPTVAYPAPESDPPVGTPEGDVESRFTGPYNLAGLPAVSVPCGLVDGSLPAGLQLAGAAGEDALVLSVAAAYEAQCP